MVGLFSFGGRLVLIIPELGRAEQRDEEDEEKEEKSKCGRERKREREEGRAESGEKVCVVVRQWRDRGVGCIFPFLFSPALYIIIIL